MIVYVHLCILFIKLNVQFIRLNKSWKEDNSLNQLQSVLLDLQ